MAKISWKMYGWDETKLGCGRDGWRWRSGVATMKKNEVKWIHRMNNKKNSFLAHLHKSHKKNRNFRMVMVCVCASASPSFTSYPFHSSTKTNAPNEIIFRNQVNHLHSHSQFGALKINLYISILVVCRPWLVAVAFSLSFDAITFPFDPKP